MKIGIFTDSHYCDKEVTCKTRRPVLSKAKIKEAMDSFKDTNLIICLGDFVDDCGDKAENIRKIEEIMEMISSYNKKFFCLRGNHDCHILSEKEFSKYTKNSLPPFSIEVENKTLIFLNANYTSEGKPYEVGKVDWSDAMLPKKDVEALKDTLKNCKGEAYIFIHQNLDPDVQWQHIVKNAEEIRQIISESKKVNTVFQGHYHDGHDTVIDGVKYHTLRAMCEGEENYFEKVEI